MTQEHDHPITPPPELVERLRDEALNSFPDDENPCPCDIDDARDEYIATQAARWGADQELEACCDTLRRHAHWDLAVCELVADRRPKPPSLKEQALKELAWVDEHLDMPLHNHCNAVHTIRRALEQLDG